MPVSDRKLAYFLLRFTLGVSIFFHGVTRLPHLGMFANTIVKQFADTPLPAFLVRQFAVSVAIIEAITGFLLITGCCTRWALVVGILTMASFIFGNSLIADFPTVAIDLTYTAIYAVLLAALEYNSISVDMTLLKGLSRSPRTLG
ncbi:MAG: DoxX family membrane protein [Acidobacteriia bacterium]|nr:DoxX family membrane protein [Terriglobia bacterium]